jgi:hypothetical protein
LVLVQVEHEEYQASLAERILLGFPAAVHIVTTLGIDESLSMFSGVLCFTLVSVTR